MRKAVKGVLWLAGLGVWSSLMLLLSGSWWLPRVLPAALARAGVAVTEVRRADDGGIRIALLEWSGQGAHVRLHEVELPPPDAWLAAGLRGRAPARLAARAASVEIRLDESGRPQPPAEEAPDPPRLLATVQDALARAHPWLPRLEMGELRLVVGARQAPVHGADDPLMERRFAAAARDLRWHPGELTARLSLPDYPGGIEAVLSLPAERPWELRLLDAPEGASARAMLELRPESMLLDARLDRGGDSLRAEARIAPGSWIPAAVRVRSDGFAVDPGWLPVAARHYAVRVTALDAAWAEGAWRAALALDGQATLPDGETVPVHAEAQLAGDLEHAEIRQLSLSADWVRAGLTEPVRLDFAERRIIGPTRFALEADLSRQAFVAAGGLVRGFVEVRDFGEDRTLAEFTLEASGFTHRDFATDSISAEGRLADGVLSLSRLQVCLPDGAGEAVLTGKADLDSGRLELEFDLGLEAQFLNGLAGRELAAGRLAARGTVGGDWREPLVEARVEPLPLAGAWPEPPTLEGSLELRGMGSARFEALLRRDAAELEAGATVELSGRDLRVAVERLTLRQDGAAVLTLAAPFQAEWSADAPLEGLRVSPFAVDGDGVRLEGGLCPDAGIRLVARSRGDAPLWEWIGRQAGVRIEGAALAVVVEGSLQEPHAELDLRAAEVDLSAWIDRGLLPPVRDVSIQVRADPQVVRIERLDLTVSDSVVRGRAELPLPDLSPGFVADWGALAATATGELELVNWQAQDWGTILPPALRPVGQLDGTLALRPGLLLTGHLEFGGFSLRPTTTFPTVDQIGGRIEFKEAAAHLSEGRASVGGSPVRAWGGLQRDRSGRPAWELRLQGENVPLVRMTEMILRSDLDLSFTDGGDGASPLVSGTLGLRSSSMLINFDPLAPGVRGGPARRPPFFDIPFEATRDWRFAVAARGDRFLRVRSPYFAARLSADLELGGTFAEPLLSGWARVAEGDVRFPGARMRLDHGEAFIDPARPDVVQLDFGGVARRAAHVVTMEITHTLDDPHVQFRSTPPLPNASIIRLLATGSPSGGGLGTVGLYLGQGLLGVGSTGPTLADRLTVDLGQDVSASGRNTLGVRYDFGRRLYLQGEYDVFDAYNLDLVWTLYQR